MFFRKRKKVKRPLYRRIINAFIYFGVGLIALLMITFAVTQTSTFRNWLRETVIEQVNSSTNGSSLLIGLMGPSSHLSYLTTQLLHLRVIQFLMLEKLK